MKNTTTKNKEEIIANGLTNIGETKEYIEKHKKAITQDDRIRSPFNNVDGLISIMQDLGIVKSVKP